jgi:hypothetical protein
VCKLDSGKPVFNAFYNFSVDTVSETGIVGANLLKLSSSSARMAQNKLDRLSKSIIEGLSNIWTEAKGLCSKTFVGCNCCNIAIS